MSKLIITTDVALNDSDKLFATPGGILRRLLYARVELITTATAGVRQIALRVMQGATIIFELRAGATQIASLTVDYFFGSELPRETAVVAGSLLVPIPRDLVLDETLDLRVLDTAAIDAAADDMSVFLATDDK